jgi:hypothetical protein
MLHRAPAFAVSCENINKPYGSIKGREFQNYFIKDSAPWS